MVVSSRLAFALVCFHKPSALRVAALWLEGYRGGNRNIGGTVAQRTTVIVTDDLDGSEGADTVTFAFEGIEYQVDLSESNAKKLKKALDPYISAARKTGGRRSSGRRSSASSSRSSSSDTAAIREWARSRGLQVSERGRVPQSLRDQYAAANG